MPDIKHIGIVGAGTMGRGIAQVFAQAGFEVSLYDVMPGLPEKAKREIEQALQALVAKQKITDREMQDALNRILPAGRLEELNADLVVEAIAEDGPLKKDLFQKLENIVTPDTILATNTSSLSVTELSSVLKYPHRFAGLHFFNPAPLMKLVEVVRGALTSETVVLQLSELVKKLSKYPVTAHDSPGFIVNRVARPYYTEALKLLEEQVASIETVDRLMRATGFKMGPFELMDLIGNDVNYVVTRSVYEAFAGEPRFRPSRIQEQKVKSGHLGRKSGKGFYDYDKK
ncbi:MAG: 3-hydroxyacyl-CoA dehydrogenase NAD-binding domain-containing protein [Cyclobacteriaceae bacterium]|nr:3-hydroxyacyl-CoA dehydrogenase NAD-binding domain-containing protein [Cyclobacteriaceae bacterium]MDW8332296.1 3-hydroxyacyl-CoA dehydrogenase NAD-binding domain-containing protein [Cyclobacteriaceae bacterium]